MSRVFTKLVNFNTKVVFLAELVLLARRICHLSYDKHCRKVKELFLIYRQLLPLHNPISYAWISFSRIHKIYLHRNFTLVLFTTTILIYLPIDSASSRNQYRKQNEMSMRLLLS